MKLSRFNLWVDNYPKSTDNLLFNTRTQALIKVSDALRSSLDDLGTSRNQELLRSIPALKQSGIIVDNDAHDDERLGDFFTQLKRGSPDLPFEVTILTTYQCNLRCVYCFEESVKDDAVLDDSTAAGMVRWIKDKTISAGAKKLYLVYYGGEPLLNVKPIYEISWELRQWARENGIAFGFCIVTNGCLISRKLIEHFCSVGLEYVRVTLDGDRQAHDKKRPYADGRPSFEKIIGNIKGIIDSVGVGVVGNFDRENLSSIPRLLDYLEQEGLLRKLRSIDFAPLAPRLGPRTNPGAIEMGGCLSFFDKDGLHREILSLRRELLRRGVLSSSGLAINACSLITRDSGACIDPRGVIYSCNALLGYPEFSIGTIASGSYNATREQFLSLDAWKQCPADCPYVPMCQGGCRFYAYLENKDFNKLCCKRDYFDAITPELIKLEYDLLTQGTR